MTLPALAEITAAAAIAALIRERAAEIPPGRTADASGAAAVVITHPRPE